MKLIGLVIKWLWWLGVLYTPAALHNLEWQFMDSISCPPVGDCYVPGSEMLINFDMLIIGLAFYLWPVCIWFLGGRYAFSTVRSFVCKHLNHHASGTSNGAHYVKD